MKKKFGTPIIAIFPMFGQTNIGARLMANPNNIINTLGPRQNGHHFAGIFKCISSKETIWITIKI